MNRYIPISLFVIVAACDLVVDVDIPFEKKLVLNSIVHPDSVWSAQVSNNKHILDSLGHPRVDNAVVVIYENGFPIDTLQPSINGYYRSDNGKPVAGKSYEIKVKAGAFDPISAETSLPNPAPITDVQITEIRNGTWNDETVVKIKFLDNGNEKNFYQIHVYYGHDALTRDFQVVRYYYSTGMTYEDPTAMQDEPEFGYENGILLKDILFNGKEKEITLKANYLFNELVLVEVRTINEDYYNYLVTRTIQGRTDSDPLAQPINVYSNVQNGFGIFAGYSASSLMKGSDIRPLILSASPTQAKIGSTVTLTVENLNLKSDHDRVSVILKSDGNWPYVYCYPVAVKSENTIEFGVPYDATTGKIAVSVRGLTGISDFELEIVD